MGKAAVVIPNIRGIGFDLEGTAVNVESAHHGAHLKVCAELGLNFTLDEAILMIPHFIGGPHAAIGEEIAILAEQRGEDISVPWILQKDSDYYEELLQKIPIEPRPGFLDTVHETLSLGLAIAIGSLTPDAKAHFLLERSGLDRIFDSENIVLASHVKKLKPAPDVFLKTAERMGIPPEQQIVFEDSPWGVQAALAAGCRAAIGMPVYNKPEVILKLLEAGAKRVFMDWREMKLVPLLQNL